MHEKGSLQDVILEIACHPPQVAVLLVKLARHGESGKLLVDGLRHKDARIIFRQREGEDGRILKEREEIFVAGPCAVEEDVVAERADAAKKLSGIQKEAVIGRELEAGKAVGSLLFHCGGREPGRFLAEADGVKRFFRQSADDAAFISLGGEIGRKSACGGECGLRGRLVVIPVEKNEVAL